MRNRIFYTITRSEKGGAQVHLERLLVHFRGRYEIVLAVGEKGYLYHLARRSGIETHFLPNLVRPVRPVTDLAAYRALIALLGDIRPALVHAHSFKAGCLARLAAQRLGLPNVLTAHGWSFCTGAPSLQRLFGSLIERHIGRRTTHIITVSKADERLALRRRIVDRDRIVTIHNALPDLPQPPRRRIHGAVPQIICVARLAPQKHHYCLLRALTFIEEDFRLILIGNGPLSNAIRARIVRLGLAGRVQMIFDVKDVATYLSQSDLFVLSSRWEGLPVSILEAMRASLPVVATAVGGVAEMVEHERNGLLVDRDDHFALAMAIRRLLRDAALRERLGDTGRRMFEARFRESSMIEAIAAVYRNILGQPGS